MPKSEAGWLAPAVGIVVAVSLLRLALLAFNRTDLFVDESAILALGAGVRLRLLFQAAADRLGDRWR